jgi:hypothetical protein
MTNKLVTVLAWVVSVGSIGTFLWGTWQQTTTQRDLNDTMGTIVQRMQGANALLEQTNKVVEPLDAATSDLVTLNALLENTLPQLQNMNVTLAQLAADESDLITNVGTFNQDLGGLINGLNQTQALNAQLYATTVQVDKLTSTEASYLSVMAQKGRISIDQLAQLNKKFQLVGVLPGIPGLSGSSIRSDRTGGTGLLNLPALPGL